tara:strand:+ start:2138 stop:2623 length:486 start_codon:yes stop_codon:yes gene_type:complete
LLEIDQDFDLLKQQLLDTKKPIFEPIDFYLAEDYHGNYYLPHCNYSLTTFNLVRTFQEVDISLNRCIIFTNQPGYINGLKSLIADTKELPIVFDDCWSVFGNNNLDTPAWQDIDIDAHAIQRHALTMLGAPRLHRNALYNHIQKNNYFDKIATSYRGVDEG